MPIDHEKQQRLKDEFTKLDVNGDGQLSLPELKAMLKKGNPNMTDRQIQGLYRKIDKDGDGAVDFNEFVDYLFAGSGQNRSTAGRRDRIAAASGPREGADEGDWTDIMGKINAEFGGADGIDGREFIKICTDAGLIGRKMNKNDADLIFAKVKARNARKIDNNQLKDAFRLVAQKQGCSVADLQQKVSGAQMTLRGTVADNVRFHDDKSSYTGAHAQNVNHGDSGGRVSSPGSRHDRLSQQAAAVAEGGGDDEEMWGGASAVFDIFATANGTMEGRDFVKLIKDAGLVRQGLTNADCDLMFSKYAVNRKLQWDGFQNCIRTVADKKRMALSAVISRLEQVEGPSRNATQADNVRFHDDDSQYTGMHRSSRGLDNTESQEDRRSRVARRAADDEEGDWEGCRQAFDEYAGRNGDMEGKEFNDLIRFSGLVSRTFDRNACDLIFAKVKPRGQRSIVFDEFQEAVRLIAQEKDMPIADVQSAVTNNQRQVSATQASYNRFHDDEDAYTGSHYGKHH